MSERDELLAILKDEDNYTYTDWTPELNAEVMADALLAHMQRVKAEAWDLGMWTMYNTTSSEWPPIPEENPFRGEPTQQTTHYVVDEDGITPPLGSVASDEWGTS
jgi:hypothetical protein